MRYFALIAVPILAGCVATPPAQKPVTPLVVASCPPLTPLTDDSFGATVNKLAEVASTYNECRKALGLQEESK